MKFRTNNFLSAFVPLCCAFLFLISGISLGQSNDKLNQLVNDRNDLLNQYDVYSKADKTFKNKKAIADYQALIKKIIDLDAQIVGQASYAVEQANKAKEGALKKAKEKKGGVVISPASDSLINAMSSLQDETGNLQEKLKHKTELLLVYISQNDSLQILHKKLTAKLDTLAADNKSLNQKNLLLIIFNFIVILALIGFLVYLMRKPSVKKSASRVQQANSNAQPIPQNTPKQHLVREQRREEPVVKISSEGIMHSAIDGLELKLEQIEKLAKLREKGYLTEEEFAIQKRQILG